MRVSALRNVCEHHCHDNVEVVSQEGREGKGEVVLCFSEKLNHADEIFLYFHSHVGIYVVCQDLVELLHLCHYLLNHQADIRVGLEVGWHGEDSIDNYFVSFSDKLQNRDDHVDVVGAEHFFKNVFEGLRKIDPC